MSQTQNADETEPTRNKQLEVLADVAGDGPVNPDDWMTAPRNKIPVINGVPITVINGKYAASRGSEGAESWQTYHVGPYAVETRLSDRHPTNKSDVKVWRRDTDGVGEVEEDHTDGDYDSPANKVLSDDDLHDYLGGDYDVETLRDHLEAVHEAQKEYWKDVAYPGTAELVYTDSITDTHFVYLTEYHKAGIDAPEGVNSDNFDKNVVADVMARVGEKLAPDVDTSYIYAMPQSLPDDVDADDVREVAGHVDVAQYLQG